MLETVGPPMEAATSFLPSSTSPFHTRALMRSCLASSSSSSASGAFLDKFSVSVEWHP